MLLVPLQGFKIIACGKVAQTFCSTLVFIFLLSINWHHFE